MGMDIIGYVQYKNKDNKWNILPLFRNNYNDTDICLVSVCFRGYDIYDILREDAYPLEDTENKEVYKMTYKDFSFDDDVDDENIPTFYSMSWSFIKYMMYAPASKFDSDEEIEEKRALYKDLDCKIGTMVDISEKYVASPDNVRYVFFGSC